MLKIGDFSKLSRISIQMLRHYNKIGLLLPSFTDAATGYRFYDEELLPTANRIQALKEMGFSLVRIKEILHEGAGAAGMEKLWEEQLKREKEELATLQKRILLIENTMENQDELHYSITAKEIPALDVMARRGCIGRYDREGELWTDLFCEMKRQNAQCHSPSYYMAVFHDEGYVEKNIDVEVQCAVTGAYKSTTKIEFKTRSAVFVASTTYKGDYSQLSSVNASIMRWIKANGYYLAAPGFNIYHVSPQFESDPGKMVTEVCFPLGGM